MTSRVGAGRLRAFVAATSVAGVFSGLIAAAPATAQRVTAIKAGKIITLAGSPIQNGVILVKGGRIVAVGANVAIPPGAEVIDASLQVVMPGLVAPLTSLAERADSDEAVTPQVRALDSFDFYKEQRRLLEGGITSAYVSAGARRLVGGQGAIVKLSGPSPADRTLLAAADIHVTLGDAAKDPPSLFRPPIPPTTDSPILPAQRQLSSVRPSELAVLRQLLSDARTYANRHEYTSGPFVMDKGVIRLATAAESRTLEAADRRAARMPAKMAALVRVVRGELPLRITAHRAGDIMKALQLADEQRVQIVIEGATEGYAVAAELARRHVPVVVQAVTRLGRPLADDLTRPSANGRARLDNVARLLRAGVRVALAPPDDVDLPDMLMLAACEVARGVSTEDALRMVTAHSSGILGVGGRVGVIAPGRDADLLVLSGGPLETRTRVERVLISGATVFTRPQPNRAGAVTAIKAGRILTVTGGEIVNGTILVRDGKIVAAGRGIVIPAGAKVIDAGAGVVMPGMIDAHSHVGLHADAEPAPLNPPAATSGAASGRTKLLDALTPHDPAFAEALRAGVTTVLLAPPAGGQVCGMASLIKTADCAKHATACKELVVKEYAALCFNIQGGAPRMSQPWAFRDLLARAKDYLQRRAQYERDMKQWEIDRAEAEKAKKALPREPAEVLKDEDLEPFAALFRKEVPALVHANRADEIESALTVFGDENGLPLAVLDAADGYRVSDDLAKKGAAAAVGPATVRREKGKTINNAEALAEAGVRILFHSSATSGVQLLRQNAAYAVRNGLDPVDALRALTINPAKTLKVEDRLGSIEAGKDADLVILSGDPFDVTSSVLTVLVDGKVVYDGR